MRKCHISVSYTHLDVYKRQTLYNDAFVLKNGKISDGFYCMDNFKIEVELIKKAASPKGKKYGNREEYIIFPYYFDRNDTLQHYTCLLYTSFIYCAYHC